MRDNQGTHSVDDVTIFTIGLHGIHPRPAPLSAIGKKARKICTSLVLRTRACAWYCEALRPFKSSHPSSSSHCNYVMMSCDVDGAKEFLGGEGEIRMCEQRTVRSPNMRLSIQLGCKHNARASRIEIRMLMVVQTVVRVAFSRSSIRPTNHPFSLPRIPFLHMAQSDPQHYKLSSSVLCLTLRL